MQLFFNIFIFAFGLIIGSFLNVVILRLEKGEGLGGRSYCPHCRHQLNWKDLFPVASFLLLKRKCRYCSQKISFQYPLVELATGLIFLFIVSFQLPSLEFSIFYFLFSIFWFYVACSLIVIFVYDLKHYLIPDAVLFPAIIITVMYQLMLDTRFLLFNSLWAALAAFTFFGAIYLISQGRWMGFGDCKLAIFLGLILGFPNILAGLFIAFFVGAIVGIALMFLNIPVVKKMNIGLKSELPFAPFLIFGTFLAMFSGDALIQWYLSLIFGV